jgi:tripartite-type tricarboxylate transporter receptor subunit TctC
MSQFSRRVVLRLTASGMTMPFMSLSAMTQISYPTRPINLIVGFTPGTAADITARAFSNGAEGILGQTVVVEDKPGAGSSVAAEYVARAAKDGYTLFLSSLSIVTSQVMNPDTAFDLARDFAPISLLASGAVVLVVSPQSNLHSVAELIALAKSKPGEVLCANAGIGSLPHMAAEFFAQRVGITRERALPGQSSGGQRSHRRQGYDVLLASLDGDWSDRSGQTHSAGDGRSQTRERTAGCAIDGGNRDT